MKKLEILFLLIALIAGSFASLQCRDDVGAPVDWWVMYKFPSNVFADSESGLSYVYITSDDDDDSQWKLSKLTLDNPKNMFHRTVEPYFRKNKKDQLFAFYNDQIWGKSQGSKAHAKGVFGGDDETGFWIIHSIPNFIEKGGDEYEFPSSGEANGQIALCISISSEVFEDIAEQLLRARVHVYLKSNIKKSPALTMLTRRQYFTKFDYEAAMITTNDGVLVTHYCKKQHRLLDIISWISTDLEANVYIQSWTHGRGTAQESDCTDIKHLKNIVSIKIKFLNDSKIEEVSWRTSKDHSKWLVSSDRGTNYLCIGDLNRMESQVRRGGGMLCFKHPSLSTAFSSIIDETEPCKPPLNDPVAPQQY